MKNNFSALFAAAVFTLLFASSCNKVGELCFDFANNTTVPTNATAKGNVTVTKTLGTALTDELKSKGISTDKINTVNVSAITVTIPSTAGFTFADFTSAEVIAGGVSMGKLPTGATGLVATFSAPAQKDFKAAFLGGTSTVLTFNAVVTKDLAATTLTINIPLNTCYQVL